MESNKDLEDFRKQWKRELNRDKFSVDGKSSPQNSSNLKQNASNLDCDTDKTKDVQHALFSVEESKSRPNTYQSFLLAEDLLKQNDSEIHETYSSNVLRRKRSSCDLKDLNNSSLSDSSPSSKVPKCDDEKNRQKQTKERFLDIFIADLVSTSNSHVQSIFFFSFFPFQYHDACILLHVSYFANQGN